MRIGFAAFSHETNTFAIEHNYAMDKVHIQSGRELLESAHPKSFIGGFFSTGCTGHFLHLLYSQDTLPGQLNWKLQRRAHLIRLKCALIPRFRFHIGPCCIC